MGAAMRDLDWSRTALGAVAEWPQSLRTSVSICLGTSFPMMVVWGPELVMLYNDAYRPVLGSRKHPGALGRPLLEVWHEIKDLIGPMFRGVLATGQAIGAEDMMFPLERHGYTEETYFTFSYSPIRDESGRVGGVLTTCTETTHRVVGERRLRGLRNLAERATQAKTVEDVLRDSAGALDPAEVPFALFYRRDADEMRARLVATIGIDGGTPASPAEIPLDQVAPWPIAWAERTLQPTPARDAVRRLAPLPGGAWPEAPTDAMVLPLARTGSPQPYGFLVAGVSPRRALDDDYRGYLSLVAEHVAAGIANARAHEEEQQRAASLAAIDRAKTAFFGNVSHELRTPLTLILGPLEDLRSGAAGPIPDAVSAEVDAMHRNALRLLKLVNSLLDFARIEAGRVEATYEPVDLAAVTRELAGVFRSAIERAGLRLVVECDPMPEPVHVDPTMWEKIVLNLLSNAFKFTFEGEISVALRWGDGQVELEVRDSGIGIAATDLPRVFDRFHRVAGARSRTYEGTGIGLALVQELLRLHGGTIEVESEPGRGSTFRATVKTGTAHLPRDRIGAPRTLEPTRIGAPAFVHEALGWIADDGPPAEPAPSAQPTQETVLVVDDNADMRDYLARVLGRRWFVHTAPDGQTALHVALERPPHLVLADVMMPGLDGFGLLRALRADPRTKNVPVLMLSARAGEEARVEGLDAGADDYLVKPFSARELTARVASHLGMARARQEAAIQRESIRALFMQAPVPMCILRGREMVIELANAPCCAVWGRTHDQVIGRPLFEALPEVRGQVFEGLLQRVYETGEIFVGREAPARLERRAGAELETVYFNFVYAPLRSADGGVDGILVLAFDVTHETLARGDMERLRVEAESASRAKDEFLAMLGHELRNPLSPIVTALQLMRLRGGEQAPFERERSVIERQVAHLSRLVDDLLDVSRIARGKLELNRRRLEVAEVAAQALEIASPILEARQHRVHVDVPPAGLVVDGDPDRLAQVIANLLTNAAKYTEPRGRIELTTAAEGDRVAIRVRDDGVGIAPSLLPRVFDLFVQERRGDSARQGLGLGLTIVRNLVQLHGGTVDAHSDGPGRGTEMVVRLPLLPVQEAFGGRGERHLTLPAALGRPRVLVVDDNVDAAETLAEGLRTLGFDVAVAHDGPSALGLAREFEPVACVVDIGLPVMDGIELAGRLREALRGRARLLALTGYGQPRDRERTRAAGFARHFVKPVDLTELARTLQE